MANEGQGSARIILVGGPRDTRPPEVEPVAQRAAPVVQRPVTPEPGPPTRPSAAGGWTVRRLVNGGSLAGIATVAGGLVFQKNFQLFGSSNRTLLAMGFGLFVVGMVVLTLCLIGLAAAAVRALVASQGWAAAVLLAFAPAIPLVLLNTIGVLSYAFPAFFVIVVAGGFTLALKR
jgi:hypothetical protein